MAGAAGFLLTGGGMAAPLVAAPLITGPVVPGSGSLLAALKDELFALETDKLQGRLDEGAYLEQKAALEVVLRRALARSGSGAQNV